MYEKGDLDQAEMYLQRTVELQPQHPDAIKALQVVQQKRAEFSN